MRVGGCGASDGQRAEVGRGGGHTAPFRAVNAGAKFVGERRDADAFRNGVMCRCVTKLGARRSVERGVSAVRGSEDESD